MPWFDELHGLPARSTDEVIPPDLLARIESRQHPDQEG